MVAGGCCLALKMDRCGCGYTATGACLAVVPDAHGGDDQGAITAACALPDGRAATGSCGGDGINGGTVQRWKWDEAASTLRPEAEWPLWEEDLREGGVCSLAAVPGLAGPTLLAGHGSGALSLLDNASGGLDQQAWPSGEPYRHEEFVSARCW